jgi:hypothetical protein
MEPTKSIDIALAALEQARLATEESPAIIRLAPDSDAYVLGNRDGYVQLAIASLKAAQGHNQSFKNVPWVDTEEEDWGLHGLRYDSSAHVYLRSPETRLGKFWSAFIPLALAVCCLVGLGTIGYGVVHLFMK